MKRRLLYILALLAMAACVPDVGNVVPDDLDASLEGKPVTVTFSLPGVRIAPQTKTLTDGDGLLTGEPYLDPDHLFLAVCGGTQSIKYIRKAAMVVDPTTHEPVTRQVAASQLLDYDYPIDIDDGDVVELYDFTVQLELSNEPRTIHFLGNIDDNQLEAGAYAYQLLPTIVSYPGKQAYWQKVYMAHGIKARHKAGSTTEYDVDEITGSYFPDNQTKADLEYVPLIRNYAKIRLVNRDENFELHSYALIYRPKQGSVTPYRHELTFDRDHPDAGFSFNSATRFSGYEASTFINLDEDFHYSGNLPAGQDVIDKTIPTDDMFKNATTHGDKVVLYDANDENQGFYIYERGIPTDAQDPSFIILRGKMLSSDNPDQYYYYRLDLMETKLEADDVVSKYYPIYRNFYYCIDLYNVASEGVLLPEDALERSGADNISADVTMRHLGDISNNLRRLVVEPFMAHTYTGPLEEPETLIARFYDDYTSDDPNTAYKDVFVEIEPIDGPDILYIVDGFNEYHSGDIYYPIATDEGYRIIRFNLTGQGDVAKTQKIKITGWKYGDTEKLSLYREVEITLQGRQRMQVVCEQKPLPSVTGSEQPIRITIPTGLVESMFPLKFIIEAEENTLTPVPGPSPAHNMPVRAGTSIITSDADPNSKRVGQTTFQFIRTLDYSEYLGLTDGTFYCYFKSNRNESATKVYVKDEADYFYLAWDYFDNPSNSAIDKETNFGGGGGPVNGGTL